MRAGRAIRGLSETLRTVLGIAGIYAAVVGAAGVVWSVRAAQGHWRYERMLRERPDPEPALLLARQAFRYYPRQYGVCIVAADIAFSAADRAADGEEADAWRREAGHWARRGLALNPRLMELWYLQARLLARENPVAGAAHWAAYVDWHFWNPRNQEILADFQEQAGLWRDALDTLEWLGPGGPHEERRARLRERLANEPASPAPAAGG